MRKIIGILALVILLNVPQAALAGDGQHWAYKDVTEACANYNLDFAGAWDDPAEPALQEKIFALAGLPLQPKENITRKEVIYYFVNTLDVGDVTEENAATFLSGYADDLCKVCVKVNTALAKAGKIGLLQGRETAEGKIVAADMPVTNAELIVLYHRYKKLAEGGQGDGPLITP